MRKCRNWQTSKTKDLVFIANVWVQVPSSALHHKYSWRLCRSGGIGRRAGFRCLWSQDRVGSSPISCILFYFIQNQKNRSAQHRHFCFFIYFSFSEKISLPPQRSAPVNMKRSEILNTTFLSFGFSTFRLT